MAGQAGQIGLLRGGWGLTAIYLICLLFPMGVFGTANSMLDFLPMPLILWLLPIPAAMLVSVAMMGNGGPGPSGRTQLWLALRLTLILLGLGYALTAIAQGLGNASLIVYGFAGQPALGRILLPIAGLTILNLAGLWLGQRIMQSGPTSQPR